ncbi:MAG: hemolysin family protein [Saprospiraceae bacterium]|nr:hemolysin family protein [Saprospiraceae bacterium]
MGLLILFFILSIFFSFLCSIWEAVLLTIPPSQVEIRNQSGTWVGKKLKAFKSKIDRPLAAILTLNTIAHTVGAIGVGAQASKLWTSQKMSLGPVDLSMEAIVAAVMTLAILILSEIIPKTLGATFWKSLLNFTIYGVHATSVVLHPFVWLSQGITNFLKRNKGKSELSRAEFSAIADIGAKAGIFEEEEFRVIKNLLRFQSIRAKDIMTPRTVVVAANADTKIGDFHQDHQNLRFSRIPVFKDSRDHVAGFFLKDQLLSSIISGDSEDTVESIMRPIHIVHENDHLTKLFNALMGKREHIALVVDQYGGTSGILTMEDVIETLLGLEILDELDDIADMQQLARQNWTERAKKLGLVSDDVNPNE